MKYLIFVFTILCFFSTRSYSQTKGRDISIGKNYTIKSNILNQDRGVQIYLPEGYENSNKEYPTLYILDGQWYFSNGVAIQNALRVPGHLPEMIVVGIMNQNPLRRILFDVKKDDFLAFLENELISFVDSEFRTTKERILFGWEDAAYFTSELIFNKKELFNGAICSDGGNASRELIDQFGALKNEKDRYLYLVNSKKDIYNITETDAFAKKLGESTLNHLVWNYELFNNEDHYTLAYLALYKGLRFYYHNFPSLDFSSIKEFEDLGGISYLKTYFKKRGERFGFPTHIDNGTKNTLIWLAWNRDNFEYFEFFMTEFKDVLSTQRYASGYWQNRLGQFYLKHKDFGNAMAYFIAGISKYPESNEMVEMYSGLGDAYYNQGEMKKAKASYQKALDINPNLTTVLEMIKKCD